MLDKKVNKAKSTQPSPARDEIELLDSIIDNYGDNAAANDRNVPKDQIRGLSEEVLKEQHVKTLYPEHSRSIQNIIEFSYKDKEFKLNDQINQTVFHFKSNGNLLKIGSEEETQYNQFIEMRNAKETKLAQLESVDVKIETSEQTVEKAKRLLRSHFNYNDCLSQTVQPILKDIGFSTEAPKVSRYNDSITQWCIYDRYMQDIKESAEHLTATDDGNEATKEEVNPANIVSKVDKKVDIMRTSAMKNAMKIIFRIVSLNSDSDVFEDFAFYEDEADKYRSGEGVLLPLWRFYNEKLKRKCITCIAWSNQYNDLFACGFGSYSFENTAKGGGISIYSLKNTKTPENVIVTESGICAIDWHPRLPYLIACGLYDGSVAIYDVRSEFSQAPLFVSTYKQHKHCEPVWGVKWSDDESSGILTFYSVSSDGRVVSWSFSRNAIESEDILELRNTISLYSLDANERLTKSNSPLELKKTDNKKASLLSDMASGICMNFHPVFDEIFLIGTESGQIFKCSLAHKKKILKTFVSHTMPVYAVSWNKFHPNVFLSASADWTVKLWDDRLQVPLRTFDLGRPVGDVVWSSYSSTVFAAVSTASDSTCNIYDLSQNKYEPICSQAIVKKTSLTHVAFSSIYPVLLVSDQRGGVSCLKLSPNLRKPLEKTESDVNKTDATLQIEKLEKFISTVAFGNEEN